MVDPHNHTKHSSCRRSHYQTQLFIFKGRKISLSHVWSEGLWTDKLCFNYPFKRAQWKMITESFRLEGASGDHLVKPPAQARLPGGGHPGPRPESFWVITKDGDSTASSGNLFLCLTTPSVTQKHFLGFPWAFFFFSRPGSPSSRSLSSEERCSSPSVILMAHCSSLSSSSASLVYWGAPNRTQCSRWGLTHAE